MTMARDQISPNPDLVIPELLPLECIKTLLDWYCANVCGVELTDPRGYRIKVLPENFIHLIKLTNKFHKEPKNARLTLDEIKRGRIQLKNGHFDPHRACELSWATLIARQPDRITVNWKPGGSSGEAYIKNFGTLLSPNYRVLICQIHGTQRRPVTIFPREHISGKELFTKVWP